MGDFMINKSKKNDRGNNIQLYTDENSYMNFKEIIIIAAILIIILAPLRGSIENNLWRLRSISNEINRKEDIANMDYLTNLNNSSAVSNSELPHNELKSFSLDKDIFTFKNIETFHNGRGVCSAIAYFEKLNYMNRLDELDININGEKLKLNGHYDLSNVTLNEDEVKKLYKGRTSSDVSIVIPNKDTKTYSSESLYDLYTGNYQENFKNKTNNDELRKILSSINYLQTNNTTFLKETIEPYRYSSKSIANNTVFYNIGNKYVHKELDIKDITEKIDNDEPVGIGITNKYNGHAVLGYKYEYINENTLKVYVTDSNYPLLKAMVHKESNIINEDIRSLYVLFNREDVNQRWHYIYDPTINSVKVYNGQYNSYIPDVVLYIF
jgi:hypothetical protein